MTLGEEFDGYAHNIRAELDRLDIGSDLLVEVNLGGTRLEVERRRLVGREVAIELTPAEMRLLLALRDRRGHLVSYRELVERVQGYQVEPWEAAAMVRPIVSRLRRKLLMAGASPGLIVTVRGAGYLLLEGRD